MHAIKRHLPTAFALAQNRMGAEKSKSPLAVVGLQASRFVTFEVITSIKVE